MISNSCYITLLQHRIGHTSFTEGSNGLISVSHHEVSIKVTVSDLQAVLKSIFILNGNVMEKLSTNVLKGDVHVWHFVGWYFLVMLVFIMLCTRCLSRILISCQPVLYYTVIVLFYAKWNASWQSSGLVEGATCLWLVLPY